MVLMCDKVDGCSHAYCCLRATECHQRGSLCTDWKPCCLVAGGRGGRGRGPAPVGRPDVQELVRNYWTDARLRNKLNRAIKNKKVGRLCKATRCNGFCCSSTE